MVKRFQARKRRKPPRDVEGAPTHLIPGYGDYQVTKGMKDYMERNPNDGAPKPRYGAQRTPYQKGQRKRKRPYKTQRGDAARWRQPRIN